MSKEEATVEEMDTAKSQAKAQLDSIIEMVDALEGARDGDEVDYEGEMLDEDAIRERINEDPLSVEVRADWHSPGAEDSKPTEYTILLCTGGPACRIIGDLSEYGEPETARIEYQDWFTPWNDYRLDSEEEVKVLTYCQQFYFAE